MAKTTIFETFSTRMKKWPISAKLRPKLTHGLIGSDDQMTLKTLMVAPGTPRGVKVCDFIRGDFRDMFVYKHAIWWTPYSVVYTVRPT